MNGVSAKRNITLDFVKFLAAYMVVFIHYRFSGNFGAAIEAIGRFAVPLFFISSGYFAYNNNPKKLSKKALRLVWMFVFASVLYNLSNVFLAFVQGGMSSVAQYFEQFLELEVIFEFLFFNQTVSSLHLWFLPALIYTYAVHILAVKLKVKDTILIIYSLIALLVHLVLGEGLSAFNIEVSGYLVRNFLLMGYPFFVIGLIFRKNQHRITAIGTKTLIVLIVLGIVESVASRLLFRSNELYIGTVFVVLAVMILTLKHPDLKANKFVMMLIACTTNIYLFHIMVGRVLKAGLLVAGIDESLPVVMNTLTIAVCVLTTLVSLLIVKAESFIGAKRNSKLKKSS